LPSITLNGTVKKTYFESAFFAMSMNHTQYKCVDEIPRDNDGNEIGASSFRAGIVSTDTQESPQEKGWSGGSTPSGLNLVANKVDHFSEANHPRVRERLEATIQGQTTTDTRIINAFRVN
jgi:hypothetical protein